MSTSAITGASSTGTTTTSSTAANSAMGRDAFLQLLITQLQNQDPMSPMDNTQFTAQLAQFSSLEQMSNMSESMDAMNKSTSTTQAFSMTGSWVDYNDASGAAKTGKVESVSIVDGVAKLKIGDDIVSLDSVTQVYAGTETFGKTKTATQAIGLLKSTVDYYNRTTGQIATGKVTAVTLENGWPRLTIDGNSVDIGDVLRTEGSTSTTTGTSDAAAQAKAMLGLKIDYTLNGQSYSGLVSNVVNDETGVRLKVGSSVVELDEVTKVYYSGNS